MATCIAAAALWAARFNHSSKTLSLSITAPTSPTKTGRWIALQKRRFRRKFLVSFTPQTASQGEKNDRVRRMLDRRDSTAHAVKWPKLLRLVDKAKKSVIAAKQETRQEFHEEIFVLDSFFLPLESPTYRR